jgi:GNAT superfamily N-acetyltransferase
MMLRLDNHIYDSQFLFLGEDVRIQKAYFDSVLSKCEHTNIGGLEAFIRREEWDSQKLGKNINRLLWLENNVTSANYNELLVGLKRTDCCYIRLNQEHSFCKQNHMFTNPLLASKVSQHIDLRNTELRYDKQGSYCKYSENNADHELILKQILDLASSSFENNRFSADHHFTASFINEMYYSWLLNEIKNLQSELYYIRNNDQVASFFLYRKDVSPVADYKIGFVSLIASSPEFAGKNFASNLMNYVLAVAKSDNTSYCIANTSTKSNDAIGFFAKNHFKVTSYLNEYHLWN